MGQGFSSKKLAFAGNGITQIFVNGVKQNSTSGTSLDFTIPAGVKQFSVSFGDVSTNGASIPIIQLGDSGGVETTGYSSGASGITTVVATTTGASGFYLKQGGAASYIIAGVIHFVLHDAASNMWISSGGLIQIDSARSEVSAGRKSLSGELTTVRITTVNGTDAFDAGSINIQYDNPDPSVIAESGRGLVEQVVHTQDGEVNTGTTLIPFDDTIPQNTEGNEFMTASITPVNAANKLKIEVVAHVSHSAIIYYLIGALFRDSIASALASSIATSYNGALGYAVITITHWVTAGSTDSTTFKFRAGHNTAGTTTFNGQSGARQMGGTMASSITITEYKA